MLVIYPFSTTDQEQAFKNAQWIAELGGCETHDIFILSDRRCPEQLVTGIVKQFTGRFNLVKHRWTKTDIDGWPQGANHMFGYATTLIQHTKEWPYFLWLEPDAIPMCFGWLDALEAEYRRAGKVFMGEKVDLGEARPDVPIHMSGVAIYPNPIYLHAGECCRAHDVAWDIAAKDQIIPKAHWTKLIQHYWKHGTFTHLNEIRPETVLFHSSKDGSLIDVLRKTAAPEKESHSVPAEPTTRETPSREEIGTRAAQPLIKKLRDGTWVLENDATSGKVIETGRIDFDPLIPHILPLIRPGDTVVDVGAFIGDHTFAYSHAVGPTGKVVAYEPNPVAFQCLVHNTEGMSNVFGFCNALGAQNGPAGMAWDFPANVASHYIDHNNSNEGDVIQVRCFDDYVSLFDRIDLIKIDVEGYEVNMLDGAEELIEKFQPKMVIEINEIALERQGYTANDIFDWLLKEEYSYSTLYRHGDTVPFYDILCLPAATPPEIISTAPAHTIHQEATAAPVVPTLTQEVEWHVNTLKKLADTSPQGKSRVHQYLVYAGLRQPNKKKKHEPNNTASQTTNGQRKQSAKKHAA